MFFNHNIIMVTHFIIYGLTGLLIEVFWTGFDALISGNLNLTGHTYIWMFFIYGLAILFEPIHDKIRRENFIFRGLIWVLLIYAIEFLSGFFLKSLIGNCPWDYTQSTNFTFWGYIRFDYFPAWFIVGLLFEKFHDFLNKRVISS